MALRKPKKKSKTDQAHPMQDRTHYASINVEPIHNGFVTTHTKHSGDGDYVSHKVFTRKDPMKHKRVHPMFKAFNPSENKDA